MVKDKYQKFVLVLCTLCVAIGIVGCGQQKLSKQKNTLQYDNKKDISTLIEHKLTEEINRLNCPNEIRMGMSVVDDLESLKAIGIIGIVRYNKGKYYSVTKVEGDKYLFLLYEEDGENYYVIDGCLVSKLADKSMYKNIEIGMQRKYIIEKDRLCFIFADYSYHRLNDKSIIKIRYTKEASQYVISEISYLEKTISVLDYLTEEDLSKIIS